MAGAPEVTPAQGAVGALQSEYGVDWQEIKAYIKSVLA